MRFFTQAKVLSAMVLGALLLLASASSARAGYFYQIFDNGVAQTGIVTPAGNNFVTVVSTTNFDITIASSFTVQTSGLTTLDSQLQAHEKATSTGKNTIEIRIAYTDYALPAGSPVTVSSSGAANFGDTSMNDTGMGQAWGDAGNTSTFNTGVTGGVQTGTSPGGTAFGVVLLPNPSTFEFAKSGNYSLKQDLKLSLTEHVNTTGQIELITDVAIPAPAGLALVLTGLPVLGLGGLLRRRKKA